MHKIQLVAVRCRISMTSLSDSRGFEIFDAQRQLLHSGVVPRYYLWNQDRSPVSDDQPGDGQIADGLVAARHVGSEANDIALVSIPDGSVISVPKSLLTKRPVEETEGVPV